MKTTMKKSVARVITLVMVLAMMMSFAVPAMATSTHNQAVVDAKQAVVQIDVYFADSELGLEQWLTSGTGFFINEDTLLTCNHLVNQFPDSFYAEWAEMTNNTLGGVKRTAKDIKENLELRVAVLRDVSVKATVKKASAEMDFAILTLEEKIYDRTTLPLRKSGTMNQTETVFSLGFPGNVADADDQPRNDASDVTSTDGIVNKLTRGTFETSDGTLYKDVDIVEHGARITGGFSGGPLVDANGNVVGVNAVSNDTGSINMAIALEPILQTLNALGIDYTEADAAAAAAEAEAAAKAEAEAKAAAEAEAAAKAEAEAKAAAEAEAAAAAAAAAAATEAATEAPTVPAADPNKGGEKPGMDMTTILIIAAVAVVAVVVVIVVVMGKNKKKPAPQPAYAGAGQTAGFQTNSYTAPMGAGETTVLGGDAGETTILGRGGNRGTLIRKRTNETVAITADSFVIGRERSNTNYCVADNSSISRRHASLVTRGGTTFLVDMNAANGTFVNGVKVMPNQEVALKNGDRIKLSDEEFEFRA